MFYGIPTIMGKTRKRMTSRKTTVEIHGLRAYVQFPQQPADFPWRGNGSQVKLHLLTLDNHLKNVGLWYRFTQKNNGVTH